MSSKIKGNCVNMTVIGLTNVPLPQIRQLASSGHRKGERLVACAKSDQFEAADGFQIVLAI